ncbi:MAG: hypothetical protein RIE58_07905 [Vicingaceae bacterium]
MRYKLDTVNELSRYLNTLDQDSMDRLRRFIDPNGNRSQFRSIIRQLSSGDSTSGTENSQEYPDHNRVFSRLKKKLEEFRLTEESVFYLKEEDRHSYEQIRLQKRILSAQVLFDQGMALSAIKQLELDFKTAHRYEFLFQQKEITDKLRRIYQIVGHHDKHLEQKTMLIGIKLKIESFEKLAATFNDLVHRRLCCDHHRQDIDRDTLFPYQMAYKATGLIKVKWMRKFLRAEMHRQSGDHKQSQELAWRLLEDYRNNEIVFSRQYYIILMQFILENMYYLNKVHVVHKASKYMQVLEPISIYQKIHLHYLYLYEQFRLGNTGAILGLINQLREDLTLQNYFHIGQHLTMFELHAHYLQGDFRKCLKVINTDGLLSNMTCCRQVADLKVLEILCLMKTNHHSQTYDRLEAFRKFLFRNEDYSGIYLYRIIHRLLDKMGKENSSAEIINDLIRKIEEAEKPIYSFQPYALNKFIAEDFSLTT